MSLKEKMAKLEKCLKKIKSKETKIMKESDENAKPKNETIDTNESSLVPIEKVKEKRKPGRPGKKKPINT